MSLQDWLDNGWLTKHTTSPEEIANLLAVSDRDLTDCRTRGLSSDWRMNIAYNAALQAATAAWWVMVEVIAGYVMLGGLISIFANKLARRS